MTRRVLLTGGSGFLGRSIRKLLPDAWVPSHVDLDLLDRAAVDAAMRDIKPDVVIHAAGVVSNIVGNKAEPGRMMHDNSVMGMNVLDASRAAGVGKFINIGTVCSYPDTISIPFKEDRLWDGKPEETNAGYGLGKRLVAGACGYYRKQYGMNATTLILANLYGPGDESGHVVADMVRKFMATPDQSVHLWGNGHSTRELLYVDDAARAVKMLVDHEAKQDVYNFASGWETEMYALSQLIQKLSGYRGLVKWDIEMPMGQKRRLLSSERFVLEFGAFEMTRLTEGLQNTLEQYRVDNLTAV